MKVKTALAKFRSHMTELRKEDGMEAAQVILILVLVVLVLIPVIRFITDRLAERGTQVGNSISNL